jgi:hypothetical protein
MLGDVGIRVVVRRSRFEVDLNRPCEQAVDVEQLMVVLPAPGTELAQIQGVGVAGEAAVNRAGTRATSFARRQTAAGGTAPQQWWRLTCAGSSLSSWPETPTTTASVPAGGSDRRLRAANPPGREHRHAVRRSLELAPECCSGVWFGARHQVEVHAARR